MLCRKRKSGNIQRRKIKLLKSTSKKILRKSNSGLDKYRVAAEKSGLKSMAQFFITAADEKIERDGLSDKEE